MKKKNGMTNGVALFLALTFMAPVSALAGGNLLPRIAGLISECAVRTYTVKNGKKVYGNLRPTCDDLQLDSEKKAYIHVGDQWFTATIEDAADSDDGDLNNVYVYDANGSTVAQRREVLAFGDILLALTGGRADVPEVYGQN